MDFVAGIFAQVSQVVGAYTTDVFFVVGVCAFFALVGFFRGKHLLVAGVFAFYPALIFAELFPWYETVRGGLTLGKAQGAVFLLVWALFFWYCTRFVFEPYARGGVWGGVDILLFALALGGALSATLFHFLPLGEYLGTTPFLKVFFAPPLYYFLWEVAPLGALLLGTRR